MRVRRPVAVDLFCGAGGLSLGLARAGFDVRMGVDSWARAVETYRLNFHHSIVEGDVSQLSAQDLRRANPGLGHVTLVAGGPPCQGFSIQRIGPDHDPRNHLVLEFGRLACELEPDYIVMENVAGLRGSRGRALLERLLQNLDAAGYETRVEVVDAGSFGVPQRRKRVLVCGWRRGTNPILGSPLLDDMRTPTVWQTIGDLPDPDPAGAHAPHDPLHVESRLSDLNRERLTHIPPGGGFEDLPAELRVRAHRVGSAVIGHRGVYGRLDPNKPAGTITAKFDSFTRGRFAHPYADRNITLREGARLQTFPDSFQFAGNREDVAALIGNAVPPLLGEQIGRMIRSAMGGREGSQ